MAHKTVRMPGSKQHQQSILDIEEALLAVVADPNFILYPRLTLSVDESELGHCGICQESQLLLRSQEAALDDQTVAILPCGHIAVRLSSPFITQTPKASLMKI